METLYPTTSFLQNPSWMMQESKSNEWTQEENKKFESALAIYDERTPNRWLKVAASIPGKSVYDVMKQYKELAADVSDIEAGLVPITGYLTLELIDDHRGVGVHQPFRKRGRSCDQERKKGVPWTEEEHRRFLMGLEKHGKGDWRNISRNFVISKTPTQVASHAQKYYLRQVSGGKDKRRPSIHDITTVNLTNIDLSDSSNLNNNNRSSLSVDKSFTINPSRDLITGCCNNNYSNDGSALQLAFGSSYSSSYPCELGSLSRGSYGTDIVNENSQLQVQSTRYQIWG